MMFPCSHCGCCCRNLDKSALYSELNRGDGVCRYLCGNDCTIYEDRPLLCRIDDCYECFFKQYMNLEEYYQKNQEICKRFKEG